MKDNEIRSFVLQKYYEKREEDYIPVNEKSFGDEVPMQSILRISEQLHQQGLIDFKALWGDDKLQAGFGRITAQGVDVVEGISVTHHNNKTGDSSDDDAYVDPGRINELKTIASQRFDTTKLTRLCEELNVCYSNGCYFSVVMLTRAILDHIPPVFNCENFQAVANNCASGSFKKSMLNLQNSLRNIADMHLHLHIREKETLPNKTQVNFSNDLDVLLAEVVRTLK